MSICKFRETGKGQGKVFLEVTAQRRDLGNYVEQERKD